MKNFWTHIEEKNWNAGKKYRVALLSLGTLYALAGFAVWLIIRIWALSSWNWMFCFIGYPVVISWIVVFLYSCSHDFHDNESERRFN